MDPIMDIRPVGADLFTYSLRAPGQPARVLDDFFGSVDLCLSDAGQALLNYFDRVEIHAAGRLVGTFTLECLLRRIERGQLQVLVQQRASADVTVMRRVRGAGRPPSAGALGYLGLQSA